MYCAASISAASATRPEVRSVQRGLGRAKPAKSHITGNLPESKSGPKAGGFARRHGCPAATCKLPCSSESGRPWRDNGGEGGIRTHGELTPTTVFETVPFDHSGTSPQSRWARCRAPVEGARIASVRGFANRLRALSRDTRPFRNRTTSYMMCLGQSCPPCRR